MNNLHVSAYIVYFVFVLSLTLVVSNVLFSNSIEYMKSIFRDRDNLAFATNRLFQMGFFLLAFGIGLWYLEISRDIMDKRTLFEVLSTKVGFFTLFLGTLVFFNLFMFFKGMKARKKSIQNDLSNAGSTQIS